MTKFARRFDVAKLSRWTKENPGSAVETLLNRWARPGTAPSQARPLRLGVRDNYLSFYVKGQCVAKLVLNGKGLQLFVPQAYVSRTRRIAGSGAPPNSQKPVKLEAPEICASETVSAVETWISTAETYAKV